MSEDHGVLGLFIAMGLGLAGYGGYRLVADHVVADTRETVAEHRCKELAQRLNNGDTSTPEMDRLTLLSYCNKNKWQEKP